MNEDYGKITIKKSLAYNKSYYPIPSAVAQKLFYYVIGVGHFICNNDFHLYRQKYNNVLVKYTVSGQGKLVYRGKTYTVGPNQVIIIKCFDIHEYYTYQSDTWENKWVHFCGGLLYEYFNNIYEHCGPVITMPEGCRIPTLIDELISLIENRDMHIEAKSSVILLDILTELFNQVPIEKINNTYDRSRSSINSAIIFIENNYSRQITLEDIAASSNYTLSHFIRTFEKIIEISPYQYLQQYRINQSKSLLTSTNMSINEIAEQVGFSNTNSYIRNFRKSEGKTPTEYRNKFSNKEDGDYYEN